jgi:hypothetical protein
VPVMPIPARGADCEARTAAPHSHARKETRQ